MNQNTPALMASVQDKVRERIQQTFVDLIPESVWTGMVEAELRAFTTDHLPRLVREAATDRMRDLLKAELEKPEWRDRWGFNNSIHAGEALRKILIDCAPELTAALFESIAIQVANNLRSSLSNRY